MEAGKIQLAHIPIGQMAANRLTKPLAAPLFRSSIEQMGLVEIID